MKHTDVVIVGGGMVGLAAALALAEAGITSVVLKHGSAPLPNPCEAAMQQNEHGYDARVSALTCASQTLLEALGVWDIMASLRISPYTEMAVWDGVGSGNIHFSSQDLHEAALGHIVENRVTVAALLTRAAQSEQVELIHEASVAGMSEPDENGLRVVSCTDGGTFAAPLVIAADGANSNIRRLASIPMWEWDYGHHAIVTTVTTEQPHQKTAWQRFTETGPLAFLPLDDPHHCSIVWSTTPDHARELSELDDDTFCQHLTRAFEGRLGRVIATDARGSFPLRQRHAKYYVKPGLAVIGDAAHTIHPLAGQGVNLGLMDAAALAEQVSLAKQRGENYASEQVLKRFQRQRQRANLQMAASMEGFKRLFDSEMPAVKLLRSSGMNLLNRLGPVKQHIMYQAMGLGDDLPVIACRPVRH